MSPTIRYRWTRLPRITSSLNYHCCPSIQSPSCEDGALCARVRGSRVVTLQSHARFLLMKLLRVPRLGACGGWSSYVTDALLECASTRLSSFQLFIVCLSCRDTIGTAAVFG